MNVCDVNLEPIDSEAYDLCYTCLLIPCQPSDQLNHVLANSLEQWMRQTCIDEYKWKVDFIKVRPDYFQWGLRVPSSTQISQFMKEIRRGTSELIRLNFEKIPSEFSPGDFWAPGYLVVLGAQPLPKEMIEQYVRLSRRQQR